MKRVYRFTAAYLVLVVFVGATVLFATMWLRRVHSVALEGGAVVVETSPDGRLANPYRTHTYIPLPKAVILVSTVLIVFVGLSLAVFWALTQP